MGFFITFTFIGYFLLIIINADSNLTKTELSEISDMNHVNVTNHVNIEYSIGKDYGEEGISQGKSDFELIENGQNTEEKFRMNDLNVTYYIKEARKQLINQAQLAAILSSTLFLLLLITLIAVLYWRKHIKKRYGSRQILNEDEDSFAKHDLKHFSL